MNRYELLTQLLDDDPVGHRLQRMELHGTMPTLPSPAVCRSLARTSRGGVVTSRWTTAAATLLCIGLLAVNPAAQAAARSILPPGLQQVIGLVGGAPTQVPAPKSPNPGRQVTPDLTLAQAQAQVSFTLPIPTPPAGFHFNGALVASPSSVYLKYTSGDETIGLWVRNGQHEGGSAVPSGTLIPVTVAGESGYLVRGSYQDNGPGTPATWNPNADVQELTWSRNGLSFDLTCENLGLSNHAAIALAESLVPQ